jgi:prophage regulatory protein
LVDLTTFTRAAFALRCAMASCAARLALRGANMTHTILRLPQVKFRVGLSRSSIYLAVSQGKFPRPVSLGARAVGWLEAEVDSWLSQRVELSRKSR